MTTPTVNDDDQTINRLDSLAYRRATYFGGQTNHCRELQYYNRCYDRLIWRIHQHYIGYSDPPSARLHALLRFAPATFKAFSSQHIRFRVRRIHYSNLDNAT
jgi:hypothetical protein